MRVLILLSALSMSFVGTDVLAQTQSPAGLVVQVVTKPKPKPIWTPISIPWQVGVFY